MSGSDTSRDIESQSPDVERVLVYEALGDGVWEDDDDMEYEPASESMGESLGESDLDETEYYGVSCVLCIHYMY